MKKAERAAPLFSIAPAITGRTMTRTEWRLRYREARMTARLVRSQEPAIRQQVENALRRLLLYGTAGVTVKWTHP